MIIKIKTFKGMAPAVNAAALPDNAAQTATNIDFSSGALKPLDMPLDTGADLNEAGTILSVYRYLWNNTPFWLKWARGVVSICLSPVPKDPYGRLFSTTTEANVPPQHSYGSLITSNQGSFKLGIPAPARFSAAANNSSAVSPVVLLSSENRVYVMTFVEETYKGSGAPSFEGPPSLASDMVVVHEGGSVNLSGLQTAAALGSTLVRYKRIYRSNAGSLSSGYQFVAQIPIDQTSYSDTRASESLEGTLPSEGWVAPPADLQGIISLPSGSLAGFSGNTISFSEPYIPTAWPALYDISVDFPVVSIACFGNGILVLTKGNPYVISGVTPGSMGCERLELGTACVSAAAVVDFGDTIVYPSTRGLMAVGVQGVRNLSEGLVNQKIWQDLRPETAKAARYDSFYIAWTSSHKIMFNTKTGDYSYHDITWTPGCAWTDPVDGLLYLTRADTGYSSSLYKWGMGLPGRLTWKSKKYRLPVAVNMAAARVVADFYTGAGIVCNVYHSGGSLALRQDVTSAAPFRLPAGFVAKEWEIEIMSNATITEVAIATSIEELVL